jgi:hypothetical protein
MRGCEIWGYRVQVSIQDIIQSCMDYHSEGEARTRAGGSLPSSFSGAQCCRDAGVLSSACAFCENAGICAPPFVPLLPSRRRPR